MANNLPKEKSSKNPRYSQRCQWLFTIKVHLLGFFGQKKTRSHYLSMVVPRKIHLAQRKKSKKLSFEDLFQAGAEPSESHEIYISFTQKNDPENNPKTKSNHGLPVFFSEGSGKTLDFLLFFVQLISSEGIQLKISVRYIGSYYP